MNKFVGVEFAPLSLMSSWTAMVLSALASRGLSKDVV